MTISSEFLAELNSYLLDIKQTNSEWLRSMYMKALATAESVMLDETTPSKERLSAFKVLERVKYYLMLFDQITLIHGKQTIF